MIARMTTDVKQSGTGLELREGQFVTVTPATNLPQGGFYVAPADGSWGEDSILVDEVDFQSPVTVAGHLATPSPGATVWVCGRSASSGAWEFQGVFSEEGRARSECRDAGYFVAPVEMDRGLPHETTDWPGLYYPLAAPAAGRPFPILLSGDPGHAEARDRAKDVLLRKSPGWRLEDCNHTDDMSTHKTPEEPKVHRGDLVRPAFVQIHGVGNKLHALGDDGVIYVMNGAARLLDGTWEISGADTSDFRFWIPLPSL